MEKEKVMNYLNENFNINAMSYSLISEIYDSINAKWCGKTKIVLWSKTYTINAYLPEFIKTMNNCMFDITIYELIKNDIIEYK